MIKNLTLVLLLQSSTAFAAERTFELQVEDATGRPVSIHLNAGNGAKICGPLQIVGKRDGEDRILYQLSKGHCL